MDNTFESNILIVNRTTSYSFHDEIEQNKTNVHGASGQRTEKNRTKWIKAIIQIQSLSHSLTQ